MSEKYNYNIVYVVVKKHIPGNVINHFGDREDIVEGYIALPAYLIHEIKKYTKFDQYEKEYLVVLVRNNYDLYSEQAPEFNLYGNLINGTIVDDVYQDYQSAINMSIRLNEEKFDNADEVNASNKNIVFKMSKFVEKRNIIIDELNKLLTSEKNGCCLKCNKIYLAESLKIEGDDVICDSCYIKTNVRRLTKKVNRK